MKKITPCDSEEHWNRRHGSKARRKLAIVAFAKKELIMLWGMLKSNQPFRSPLMSAAAS